MFKGKLKILDCYVLIHSIWVVVVKGCNVPEFSTLTNNNVVGHHSSVLKTTSIQDINSLFICLKAKHSDGRSSCTIDASINEYVVDTLGDTGAEFCYIAENLC